MKLIDQLLIGQHLTLTQAETIFRLLFSEKRMDKIFKKLILVLLQKKGEHPNELAGLIRTIKTMEHQKQKNRISYLVDGCGTGGDQSHTFNISTISCIVAAGAGAHVAKHGNRGVTSQCGSADLLEALGVKINASPKRMFLALKTCGIGYFHAPLYHSLFTNVQPLRMELSKKKMRTIFNLIGPLVNPLNPRSQVIGVFKKQLAETVVQAGRKLNYQHLMVVISNDGLDELTTTDKTFVIELKKGILKRYLISPSSLGLKQSRRSELKGGSSKDNCEIALAILTGKERGAKFDVVLLNAAAILYVSGKVKNLREGLREARKSIDSGNAYQVLKNLIRMSHGA
ncbi:MAG: anthranilate phosphoribosyltransferase [Candidatus Omnitrophica bacterium]|nr:anthranilate phosphoribosyltransferase [Candidatus Omnitrophota bacterium]